MMKKAMMKKSMRKKSMNKSMNKKSPSSVMHSYLGRLLRIVTITIFAIFRLKSAK